MANTIESSHPYFDDFDPAKNFHKVLFHPAIPVQARELTQMQSILQNQVKIQGDHIFKNGTMVVPGHVFYDDAIRFIKIETTFNQTNIESSLPLIIGKEIKGTTNGMTAVVLHYDARTATDPTTIYIKYTSAAGTINEFVTAETLTCADVPGLSLKIVPITDYTGLASICTVNNGIFYVNGYFVNVAKQTITISKYSNVVSVLVGLDYIDSIVTEHDDESLFDNATGFTNLGAPGAHRLKISLTLAVKPYEYTVADIGETKFISLLKLKDGKIEYLKNNTQYAAIEGMLAQRTFDESGNYTVNPFTFSAKEYRNNDRGQWVTNTPYLQGDVVKNASQYYVAINKGYSGVTAPVQKFDIQSDGTIYWNAIRTTAKFINGGSVTVTSADLAEHIAAATNLTINVSSGKAYVNGYQATFDSASNITVPKAQSITQLSQSQIYTPAGSYITVTNLRGMTLTDTTLTKLNLLSVSGTIIGSAWANNLEYSTGATSSATTVEYRLFLFNVQMLDGFNFVSNVQSVAGSAGEFSADIKPVILAISGSVSATIATAIVTGVGTFFDFELKVGDRVRLGTQWAGVLSIQSPTQFTTTANLAAAVTAGSSIVKGVAVITSVGDYVYKLPSSAIKTMRTVTGAIDMSYAVHKKYSITSVGTTIVMPTLTNGETYLPSEHIVVLNTALASSVTADAIYTLNIDATVLTISNLATNAAYYISAVVRRAGSFAKEKTKTLSIKTITINNAGTYLGATLNTQINSTNIFSSKKISLTEADCLSIVKITESGDAVDKVNYVVAGETDISQYFSFDNGQRSEYYDVGSITTNRTGSRPLRVTFEYLDHSVGDYFSKDSYSTIPEDFVEVVDINGTEYDLPNCLDFRNRIADNGVDFTTVNGASLSDALWSESTINTSYSYYNARQDTLSVTSDKKMQYSIGGASVEGMSLCTIDLDAGTFTPEKHVRFKDNQVQVFKMADIKVLDSRVKNVEYAVALTALETSTLKVSIKDPFGLEVDKVGYLVDAFINHQTSDTTNPDYKASLDGIEGECRAGVTNETVHLTEPQGTSESARVANGYTITGDAITLPYTEVALISQKIASKSETVQAYTVIDFIGILTSYPISDNYVIDTYTSKTSVAVLPTIFTTPHTTSISYGPRHWIVTGGHSGDCACCGMGCRWIDDYGWSLESAPTYSTSVNTYSSVSKTQKSNYVQTVISRQLRARTIVLSAKKLKPFTTMNFFLSDNDLTSYYVPCTMLTISNVSGVTKFLGSESDSMNDNQTLRATNNYNSLRNGFDEPVTWFGPWFSYPSTVNHEYLNYYDIIARGEVVTCVVSGVVTGTAIVVADETIYDKVSATNKRILYVINLKGTFAGGTITGATSATKATVDAVTAGTRDTNSMGNIYGALAMQGAKYESGNHKVLITDHDNNINSASSFADGPYTTNGAINTHTRYITYESATTVATTTNVNKQINY